MFTKKKTLNLGDGNTKLATGVFTSQTPCYSPTCTTDRPCYSNCCPKVKRVNFLWEIKRERAYIVILILKNNKNNKLEDQTNKKSVCTPR